jgi:hypothetical protein
LNISRDLSWARSGKILQQIPPALHPLTQGHGVI